MILVTFPNFEVAIYGEPAFLKLTSAEAKALRAIHLGGMEALRTPNYTCSCRTVTTLVQKGLLGHDGPTALGARAGKAVADGYHIEE